MKIHKKNLVHMVCHPEKLVWSKLIELIFRQSCTIDLVETEYIYKNRMSIRPSSRAPKTK